MEINKVLESYSEPMRTILRTIADIRKSKGLSKRTKLRPIDVIRVSATYSITKKSLGKGTWTAPGIRAEWHDIRKAIEGTLELDHPLWKIIDHFSDSIIFPSSYSTDKEEISNLRAEVAKEKRRYEDLEKLCISEQYLNASFRIDMQKIIEDADKLAKESESDHKILQDYQARCKVLEIENKKLRRDEIIASPCKSSKYKIIEPDLSVLNVTNNAIELKCSYKSLLEEMYQEVCKLLSKCTYSEVWLIFHSFNINNMHEFVAEEVPLRFPENNIIIACCDPMPTSRRTIYEAVAKVITPFKPKVILVPGIPSLGTRGNVVKIYGNEDTKASLREHFKNWHSDVNVIQEGFHDIFVKRRQHA